MAGRHRVPRLSPSRIPELPLIRSISPISRTHTHSPLFPSPLASSRRLFPQDRSPRGVLPYSPTPIQPVLLPAVSSPQRLPPTPKFSVSSNLRNRFLVRRISQKAENSPSPLRLQPGNERSSVAQLASALTHVRIQPQAGRGNETERNRRTEALVPEPWPIFNAFDSFSKS